MNWDSERACQGQRDYCPRYSVPSVIPAHAGIHLLRRSPGNLLQLETSNGGKPPRYKDPPSTFRKGMKRIAPVAQVCNLRPQAKSGGQAPALPESHSAQTTWSWICIPDRHSRESGNPSLVLRLLHIDQDAGDKSPAQHRKGAIQSVIPAHAGIHLLRGSPGNLLQMDTSQGYKLPRYEDPPSTFRKGMKRIAPVAQVCNLRPQARSGVQAPALQRPALYF